MIYPSIDKLLTLVDSKYTLVTVAAARSRQIVETGHMQINEKSSKCKTPLGKALEEISENLIHIR
ncbi:MAG: DNA-directed RNA polymerase subunit omega [Bacilli bacterium]|nr:DNA-directed RNA polymerase subunit omega [Bacilli bacterium]MDD4298840.1 DNA-directed RNA polymerase subunit omega [Bacilli bacterium]MDD4643871.1 DNA-directed RNA polymerase subunit omega [Bacilli bacterium]